MKKLSILILLLLIPTLLYARLTKEQVVGSWKLISKDHYLTMVLNRKGFVRITEGDKKHKPKLLPLGIWATIDNELKITIDGKTKFLYKHVRFKGKTITVRNRHGKIEHFRYTPPTDK
jgi:hypothetical protein